MTNNTLFSAEHDAVSTVEAPSELFHENSKHQRSDCRVAERIIAMTTNPMLLRTLGTGKRYLSARRQVLPTIHPPARLSFDDAVLSRRSIRGFGAKSVSLEETAKLLHFANGVTGRLEGEDGAVQLCRAAPSGGALYPVEVYAAALNVADLDGGLYHYNAGENLVELVRSGNHADALRRITFTDEVGTAALVVILTGIPVKTRLKYGERGYRFMLMEAGHIGQNLLLTATAMGLATVPLGGFIDDELDAFLGIDGLDEVSLYLFAVGRPLEP
jgi:SagB-type dehydrogenase family enzyme